MLSYWCKHVAIIGFVIIASKRITLLNLTSRLLCNVDCVRTESRNWKFIRLVLFTFEAKSSKSSNSWKNPARFSFSYLKTFLPSVIRFEKAVGEWIYALRIVWLIRGAIRRRSVNIERRPARTLALNAIHLACRAHAIRVQGLTTSRDQWKLAHDIVGKSGLSRSPSSFPLDLARRVRWSPSSSWYDNTDLDRRFSRVTPRDTHLPSFGQLTYLCDPIRRDAFLAY